MKLKNVALWLAGINVFFFLVQLAAPSITGQFMLRPDIFFRPWILLTHMFLHGSMGHLLFNMYALVMFGGLLEQQIGSKRFLYLYFGAGLMAGLISSFFYDAALGASGAIMGIMGTLVVLMPNLRLLLFFAIPMPFYIAAIIWVLIDVAGVFSPGNGVGNIAHLVGIAIGLAYGFYMLKRYKKRPLSRRANWSQADVDNYIRNQ